MKTRDSIDVVVRSIEATYSVPGWGLKASTEDVARDACEALGVSLTGEALERVAEALWQWQCDSPSPLAEGLASLIEDGLAPGSEVPIDEIAGDLDTAVWADRQATFLHAAIMKEAR